MHFCCYKCIYKIVFKNYNLLNLNFDYFSRLSSCADYISSTACHECSFPLMYKNWNWMKKFEEHLKKLKYEFFKYMVLRNKEIFQSKFHNFLCGNRLIVNVLLVIKSIFSSSIVNLANFIIIFFIKFHPEQGSRATQAR